MSTAAEGGGFVQPPGPDPVLRLVVMHTAGGPGPVLREALRPEAAVTSVAPRDPLPVPGAASADLPWALLAVAQDGPGDDALPAAAVRAVRAADAAGAPPALVLLCPRPGDDAPDGDPLPCPVTLLLDRPGGPAAGGGPGTGGWQRLSADRLTVRLLGPDAWTPGGGLAVTAQIIKEELRVWPA